MTQKLKVELLGQQKCLCFSSQLTFFDSPTMHNEASSTMIAWERRRERLGGSGSQEFKDFAGLNKSL